jgi:hypothetical protein
MKMGAAATAEIIFISMIGYFGVFALLPKETKDRVLKFVNK